MPTPSFKNFDNCGITFTFAGYAKPYLQEDSTSPATFLPYKGSKYEHDPNYKLLIADGTEFCKFSVSTATTPYKITSKEINLPDENGVYLWVINNIVVYIGRAASKPQTLLKRFKNGYCHISARNCYKNTLTGSSGQTTNLKMNQLVLDLYKKKTEVKIYYCVCNDPESMESTLLKAKSMESTLLKANWKYRTPTCGDGTYYPLMYNKKCD